MNKKDITATDIKHLIYHIRGKSVMVDCDLAVLYKVPTYRLNEAVKRNKKRFPEDFMFQLTKQEYENLRSQFAISSFGGRRYLPYAFTEQGVAMLSGVLNSDIAIEANINIMRAFVHIRRLGLSVITIQKKIDQMELKYDKQFKVIFQAIRQLINPRLPKRKFKMGFLKD